jgi:aminoglycoside phosphotransferase (APT) family kinase protein
VFVFDDVVLKLNQQEGSRRIERECNALALLRGSDLRVPEYIADGASIAQRDWIAMTRIDGSPPPDAAQPPHLISSALGEQLGAVTARLHDGPRPPAFGTWTRESPALVDELALRADKLHELGVDNAIVPRTELDALKGLLDETRHVVASAPTDPVLAHRDVQPRNVLVDASGALTALIDFEAAGGGDPAEDFKNIALDWRLPGFEAFVRGYRAAGGSFDAGFAERVAHHTLFWALAVLAYLGGFAPHFLPVAREAIERIRRGELPPI